MSPDEYCAQRVAKAGSSLYYALLYLQKEKRRAVTAVHAFAREVEDTVDECSDSSLARVKLAWWRSQVASIYEGLPQHPVALALRPAAKTFDLKEESFQEIIEGVEKDLARSSYPDFNALTDYCRSTGGAVSSLCAEIFGYEDERTRFHARDMGFAIRLAQVLRDVGKSARRGVIHLPLDDMVRFGVTPAEVLRRRSTPEFAELIRFQADRAEQQLSAAASGIPAVDRNAHRLTLILGAIQRTILGEIRGDPDCVLDRQVDLTPLRKLWIAWRVGRS